MKTKKNLIKNNGTQVLKTPFLGANLFFTTLLIIGCSDSDDRGASVPDDRTPNNNSTKEIVINGSGFGSGPEVKFWFSGRNPENKIEVDTGQDPEIGKFVGNRVGTGTVTSKPWTYWYDEKSKRSYVPSINNDGIGGAYFAKNMDMEDTSSELEGYLVSYRSYVPDGYSFPGTTIDQFDNSDFIETGSTYKSAWITSDGDNTGVGDLIPWTHSGSGDIQMAGNGVLVGMSDQGSRYVATMSMLSVRDHSPRVLTYIKVPTNFVTGDNITAEWSLVSTKDHKYYHGQKKMTTNSVPLNHRFIAFTGWADPERDGFGNIATTQVLLGDIYVSQGPYSRARIEIGDAPNYEECKWMFIAPPKKWNDSEVRADFYLDEIEKAKYWFITTADGSRYSGAL